MTAQNKEKPKAPILRLVLRITLPLLFLILGVAMVVAVVVFVTKRDKPLPPPRVARVNIEVEPVELQQVRDSLELPGKPRPVLTVTVSAEVEGKIETYAPRDAEALAPKQLLEELARDDKYPKADPGLEDGDYVQKPGKPLLYLNRDVLLAEYRKAKANMELDLRNYQRMAESFERNVATRQELDQVQTRLEISRAELDNIAEKLKRTVIRAPIAGTLNSFLQEEGELVKAGYPVAEMVDTTKMKVRLDIPEKDIRYIHIGRPVELRLPDGTVKTGQITYISKLADPSTRTTPVDVTVDNEDGRIRDGHFVMARLTRKVLQDAVMVPLEAVIPLENSKIVYVVDEDNRAVRREVKLGFIKGQKVRIVSGLRKGDRLIVKGHRYVGPGQSVTIRGGAVAATGPAGNTATSEPAGDAKVARGNGQTPPTPTERQ
ncbi:MAG: efflux RND transporter periplasmic adaptor subunit [Phycisphaerae bacterium]